MKHSFFSPYELDKYRKQKLPRKYPTLEIEHHRVSGSQKGGMTLVRLWISKSVPVTGIAFCCKRDSYNKKKGKSIAAGRLYGALMLMNFPNIEYLKQMVLLDIGNYDFDIFAKAASGENIQ